MIKRYNDAVCDHMNRIHLYLYDFGYVYGGTEWHGGRYPSAVSRLYYIISGDQYITLGGEQIPLEAGKCYLIPSGCFFGCGCETHMENLYFHVTLSDFSGIDILRKCEKIMWCVPDEATFAYLKACVTGSTLSDSMRLRHELEGTLLTMFEAYGFEPEVPHYSPEVYRALEYISTHLSSQLQINTIAEKAYVSISTLSKKFRNELQMTVSSYIEKTIMLEAKRLLSNTDLTIQQISERFDYCYQSYFTRRFKHCYEQTPQQFRKSLQKHHTVCQEEVQHIATCSGDYAGRGINDFYKSF
ncbi:MAG: helix-turn-helix domain-containing protein [Clostridia bacterium]|nr:helix-turn-helix domain-containing protein [Clostridia bacterium]